MIYVNRLLLATVSTLAVNAPAYAADMPVKARPVVAAPWTWAGCYVGGHVGAVRHTDEIRGFEQSLGVGEINVEGKRTVFGGGGQIGCNLQNQNIVYGIEGDFTKFRSKKDVPGPFDDDYWYRGEAFWVATVRGRVGIAVGAEGRTLLYGTGGVAVGSVRAGVLGFFGAGPPGVLVQTGKTTRAGWTGGVGIEHALAQNWTIKAEFLYVGLSGHNTNLTQLGGSFVYNLRHAHDFMIGRVGLNYKF
jgi:outer membrane immunogenic protein